MTNRAQNIRKSELTAAAEIATAQGVTVEITAPNGKVYRIAPAEFTLPTGRGEREAAECDRVFGVTR